MTRQGPIGVFDSGIGGLSILGQIRPQLPQEDIVFFADQAHVPYGARRREEVRALSEGISEFLLLQGVKLIVVACNTASAAALHHLRGLHPETPFVGMEPAVKPAVLATRTQRVGVLATPTTFQGELFASVVERFAAGIEVLEQTLPGLVECIEAGDLTGPETRRILEIGLKPLIARGVDTIVLACTHYPFVIPLIRELIGPQVQVIDPSPAIARQAARLLNERGLVNPGTIRGSVTYCTSGDPERLVAMAQRLIGEADRGVHASWRNGRLESEPPPTHGTGQG